MEMGQYAPLDRRLTARPLSMGLRREIVNRMFSAGQAATECQAGEGSLESYFVNWYEDHCDSNAGHVSAKTHRELLDIITYLKAEGETRASIRQRIYQTSPTTSQPLSDDLIDGSITLAARLWLMLPIGDLKHCVSPGGSVTWGDDEGELYCVTKAQFSQKHVLEDEIKLPRNFTAFNLERIGGIQIIWTSNFADHLMMQDDDTKVLLFHHASFLELHRASGRSEDNYSIKLAAHINISNSKAFDGDLINETLMTLALLLPSSDDRSKKWFEQKQRRLKLDPKATLCGHLNASQRQISNFRYWRDRLTILKQAFDESEPQTVTQWWQDDRKKVQWYTFWIAVTVLVLTVVFGLIGSIAGIVQAWAAVSSIPLHKE